MARDEESLNLTVSTRIHIGRWMNHDEHHGMWVIRINGDEETTQEFADGNLDQSEVWALYKDQFREMVLADLAGILAME